MHKNDHVCVSAAGQRNVWPSKRALDRSFRGAGKVSSFRTMEATASASCDLGFLAREAVIWPHRRAEPATRADRRRSECRSAITHFAQVHCSVPVRLIFKSAACIGLFFAKIKPSRLIVDAMSSIRSPPIRRCPTSGFRRLLLRLSFRNFWKGVPGWAIVIASAGVDGRLSVSQRFVSSPWTSRPIHINLAVNWS